MSSKLHSLIAERILGWKSAKAPEHWKCDSRGRADAAWELPNGELVCKECQGIGMSPAENLDDAQQIMEKSANCDWWLRFGIQENEDATFRSDFPDNIREYESVYTARCWDRAGNVCFGVALKAPLAMTLCALRAKGANDAELVDALK